VIDDYIYTTDPELSVLEQHYRALLTAFEKAAQCNSAFKTDKGNCPPDLDRKNPRHKRLERDYERAYLRLTLALKTMYPLLQPLWEAAQQLRRHLGAQGELDWYRLEHRISVNNVLAAEGLYEVACKLYFAVIGVLETPHFFALRDEWSSPAPERFFVVSGRPGYELEDFLCHMPQPPYMTMAEANAHVSESVGNSGWYAPHVYDVRKHDSLKAHVEATRNPQPDAAQQAQLPRARRLVNQLLNSRRKSDASPDDRTSIVVETSDTVIAMCIAQELRQKGWEVQDHHSHGYSTMELWVSGNGQPLDQ
jgi:hypothetical protein